MTGWCLFVSFVIFFFSCPPKRIYNDMRHSEAPRPMVKNPDTRLQR
uniref:Uncharacterized protein n=1 Tax=Anguilla anguilla TaxID=7936 RepID=A0A0E9U9K6_ANGAN